MLGSVFGERSPFRIGGVAAVGCPTPDEPGRFAGKLDELRKCGGCGGAKDGS